MNPKPSDINQSSFARCGTQVIIMTQHLLLSYLILAIISSLSICSIASTAEAVVYTTQQCNYTVFPKTGCEDELGAECVDNQCRCKPDHTILYDGRFCFRKSCPEGQYFDEYQNTCVAQRKASPSVSESHCRYDYHCFGSHVRCKLYGWNRNCVCDSGFVYGFNGTCVPLYGIGGHCVRDTDCDMTGDRKMMCEVKDESPQSAGTCQCMTEYTYNYNIDGCESNERIRERKNNMRALIILFIIAGIGFGFALTFNFGMLVGSPREQQQMLMKRLAEEKERYEKHQQEKIERQLKAAEEGQANTEVPSAPPVDDSSNVDKINIATDDSKTTSTTDKKLIAL